MTPGEVVVKEFGGVRETARQLGMSHSAVWKWTQKGVIPAANLTLILQVAKIKKVNITEKDLIHGR